MQKQNNTTKFPLATAGKRFLAKVIDIALISCLVLGLGFAIFCTDPNFSWDGPLVLEQGWRYGLFTTLMAIIFFTWMLLIPRLTKNTLGMKACKLAYYRKDTTKNFVFAIFKHELFVWEIIVFLSLIMGWTLSFLSPHQIDSLIQGSMSIFVSKLPEDVDATCFYVGTGFSCFYGVCIIFLIAIVIATFIKNGKPAFHDKYSLIYVISKKPLQEKFISVNEYKKQQEPKVPGGLSNKELEELDNL